MINYAPNAYLWPELQKWERVTACALPLGMAGINAADIYEAILAMIKGGI